MDEDRKSIGGIEGFRGGPVEEDAMAAVARRLSGGSEDVIRTSLLLLSKGFKKTFGTNSYKLKIGSNNKYSYVYRVSTATSYVLRSVREAQAIMSNQGLRS